MHSSNISLYKHMHFINVLFLHFSHTLAQVDYGSTKKSLKNPVVYGEGREILTRVTYPCVS